MTSAGGKNASSRSDRAGLVVAFGASWVAYATYYLGRKGFSVAKARMEQEVGLSRGDLGLIDTAYLVAYALGQLPSGLVGDRVGARFLVGAGMLLSAAACLAFGAGTGLVVFAVAFAINGVAQSTGWPGTTKAMAEWTTPSNRGVVMGLFSTCYQVGGIAATALASFAIARSGWPAAFRVPAAIMACVALVVMTVLREGPNAGARAGARGDGDPRRIERWRVLGSATIWSYGASYFFIKLIRYSLLFWLPYYLETALHYETARAGYLSMSFEIGGVVGTIALGLVSDRVRAVPRSAFAAASLVALAGAFLLYAKVASAGVVANFGAMALVGALLFGPDALLSGAAAQDAGGPYAAATATGFVNALGSVGGFLQGAVTVGVSDAYGWTALFDVFVGFSVLAAAALAPTLWNTKKRADPIASSAAP